MQFLINMIKTLIVGEGWEGPRGAEGLEKT